MSEPIDIVRDFCAAWGTKDLEEILGYFTADAVYHNIPMDPVTGIDAIRTTVEGFSVAADKIEFETLHIAANGNVVMTERVDHFISAARTISLPVMGTFEVVDGKIAAWRDYFDLNQFMSQMSS